jgi:hypothetical protein
VTEPASETPRRSRTGIALTGWAGERQAERAVHHERWGERRLQGGGPVPVVQQTVGAVRAAEGEAAQQAWRPALAPAADVTDTEGAP